MPINTVALLVLVCSPDNLLCRATPEVKEQFATFQSCEQRVEKIESDHAGDVIIKASCVKMSEASEPDARWAVGPTAKLFTFAGSSNNDDADFQISMNN